MISADRALSQATLGAARGSSKLVNEQSRCQREAVASALLTIVRIDSYGGVALNLSIVDNDVFTALPSRAPPQKSLTLRDSAKRDR
jgi:hypothetical protein